MKKGLYILPPLAGLMMAGTSFMASAANDLTMKATLSDATCVMTGLDQTVNFQLDKTTFPGKYKVWDFKKLTITANECPSNVAKIKITPTYTPYFSAISNTGTLGTNAAIVLASAEPVIGRTGPDNWQSDKYEEQSIVNQTAKLDYYVYLVPATESVVDGTIEGSVQFAVDFE
ncbi:type 1 fimbrial protein [Salmonella enterica subsp. enterica serovar Javiana]|nr:type 1 fimbrial protein [Salmonella enterica subsp. enterica serovar 9,12:-:1,5]EHJ5966738.1 type 1 fimbrial protein [Salmonella enterica subsp. enterica serovar Javiana]